MNGNVLTYDHRYNIFRKGRELIDWQILTGENFPCCLIWRWYYTTCANIYLLVALKALLTSAELGTNLKLKKLPKSMQIKTDPIPAFWFLVKCCSPWGCK
jgi:hypothetical protein